MNQNEIHFPLQTNNKESAFSQQQFQAIQSSVACFLQDSSGHFQWPLTEQYSTIGPDQLSS